MKQNMRTLVLWLSGKDLLKPKKSLKDSPFVFVGSDPYVWALHMGPEFCIALYKAPNAFHRMMQKLVLGFVYEMRPFKD